jgi:hypothetical protein
VPVELDAGLAQEVLRQEVLLAEGLRGRGLIDLWMAHFIDHQDQEVRPPPERPGGTIPRSALGRRWIRAVSTCGDPPEGVLFLAWSPAGVRRDRTPPGLGLRGADFAAIP